MDFLTIYVLVQLLFLFFLFSTHSSSFNGILRDTENRFPRFKQKSYKKLNFMIPSNLLALQSSIQSFPDSKYMFDLFWMAAFTLKTTQSSARLNLLIVFHKVKSDRNFSFSRKRRESLSRERKKSFNEFRRNFT
jgi:hypothetical protein